MTLTKPAMKGQVIRYERTLGMTVMVGKMGFYCPNDLSFGADRCGPHIRPQPLDGTAGSQGRLVMG